MKLEYLDEVKKLLSGNEYRVVGKNVIRVDAFEKVTGRARFTADHLVENAVIVRPVRSPHPHAVVKEIVKERALQIPGVIQVITGLDIKGQNVCGYYLEDQPLITCDKARHLGEMVALVVAETEEAAWAGADAVQVSYDPLPAVFDPREALEGDFNIHPVKSPTDVKIIKGDVEKAFEACHVIVEGSFRPGSQDHAYLEPEAAIAIPGERGAITVICTNQGPFRTRNAVAKILGKAQSQIKIVTPYIGGGFGGKDTYGPFIASIAAVATELTGRPAVVEYTRYDSFMYRFKRTPFQIRYKMGATREGKLLAIDVDYLCDCGGYTSHAIGLMKRAAYHATGVYEVPNCRVAGRSVYTNNLPVAAFNGFGNPQILFATDSMMDLLAEKLKMDPVELRLKNALVPGSRTGTNQLLDHSVGIKELIEKVAKQADWTTKKALLTKPQKGTKWRGIGVGCSWHGCGTTGYKQDWAGASVILNPDGSATYCTGIVEIGQGTVTSHAMIVAETLGIPYDWVRVEINDTSRMPDSGETHAQRGTFLGGTAALDAALKLRKRLNDLASQLLSSSPEEVAIEDGVVWDRRRPESKMGFEALAKEMYQRGISPAEFGFILSRRGFPDPETGQGDAYGAYTFGCTIAEVEVDVETGQVDVLKIYPGVAAGKILQPEVVRGQVNGCGMMGLGYALSEAVIREQGRMLNGSYTDYVIPTLRDKPGLGDFVCVEDEFRYSAFGAKGVGEIAFIATPLAVANAVHDAIGIRFYDLPLTPEKVFFALKGR
jgi:CO/xanthine dehydrogenase Mo-binding subunit